MRIRMQTQPPGILRPPPPPPVRPSTTILERFESPALAFSATERFMGFDSHFRNPTLFDSAMFPYRFSPQSDFLRHNQCYGGGLSDNTDATPVGSKLFSSDQLKFLATDHRVNYSCLQEKQSPTTRFSISSGSSVSSGTVLSSKTRIRWTQDLHEKFVECVNRLGGAEKATPKAILKLMDSDGLTIFHVKSHLQKYRMAKYIPDPAEGTSQTRNGNTNEKSSSNNLPQLDAKTSLQIKEALQIQLDVQMRLHEQLEIQRNLQLRIEEQGRQLKLLFDQQQKANSSQLKDHQCADEPSFSLDDIEDLVAEDTGNTCFQSKIS